MPHKTHGKSTRSLFASAALIILTVFMFSSVGFADEAELQRVKQSIGEKGARWAARETTVSKLTLEHKKKRVGLFNPTAQEAQIAQESLETSAPITLAAPNGTFDWRNFNGVNYVTGVRDQGNCGSCWAFATTAALEAQAAIATAGTNKNLAEQILVSCSGAGSCSGGYIDRASSYIDLTGLPPETYFSYTASNAPCSSATSGWQDGADRITTWHWVATSSPTVDAIKDALYTYGPLVTTMQVYSDFFYYHTGVYSYSSGSLQGGHAVLLVGYDDNNQCFIVKNSWGTGWGESGYFRIAYSQLTSVAQFGRYTIAYDGYQPASPTTPPSAPSGLMASAASGSQINLAWSDNSTNETGFKIEQCQGANCSNFSQIATVGAGVKTYVNSGLSGGTSYSYRVRAYNAAGDSAYSNTATAATPAAPQLPSAPSLLTATPVSSSQVDLSWVDNSSNETGFKIEQCQGEGCTSFTLIATVGAGVNVYSNTGLTDGTAYTYRVCAYNNSIGNSGYSNIATAATPALLQPPAAPSDLMASAVSQSQINLSWADNSNNESGFKIERCQGASCTAFKQIAAVGPNTTTFSNSGLRKRTVYKYRVRAYNNYGNSGYSNASNVQTYTRRVQSLNLNR